MAVARNFLPSLLPVLEQTLTIYIYLVFYKDWTTTVIGLSHYIHINYFLTISAIVVIIFMIYSHLDSYVYDSIGV